MSLIEQGTSINFVTTVGRLLGLKDRHPLKTIIQESQATAATMIDLFEKLPEVQQIGLSPLARTILIDHLWPLIARIDVNNSNEIIYSPRRHQKEVEQQRLQAIKEHEERLFPIGIDQPRAESHRQNHSGLAEQAAKKLLGGIGALRSLPVPERIGALRSLPVLDRIELLNIIQQLKEIEQKAHALQPVTT